MLLINGMSPTKFTFPNGETTLQFNESMFNEEFNEITWRFESDDEFMTLNQLSNTLVDWLKSRGIEYPLYNLYVPYFPYERMDRHQKGSLNPSSLEEAVNMLPNPEYINRLHILEPHSEKVCDILEAHGYSFTYGMVTGSMLIDATRDDFKVSHGNQVVILPDKGSVKRYLGDSNTDLFSGQLGIGKDVNATNLLVGSKVRDFDTNDKENITGYKIDKRATIEYDKTGELQYFSWNNMRETKNDKPISFFIVDDLCSYGGTFIKLMETVKTGLKQAGITNEVHFYLIVTHCELAILKGSIPDAGFDKIYTTNSMCDLPLTETKLKQLFQIESIL